jgi:hypothetical protein
MDLLALASKTETLRACTNIHSFINKVIDIAVLLITPKINIDIKSSVIVDILVN